MAYSIEPRDRNGRRTYRVRYRDPTGRQRSRSFARKLDAQRWAAEQEAARLRGGWVDPAGGRLALGVFAERWYASTAGLRASSRYAYRQDLDRYVLPTFAAVPLERISPMTVREWYADLRGRGLADSTARKALAALSQVLEAAVDDGRLARNVARGLKLPKAQRTEQLALDAVQVERLAAAITPRYATLVRFAAWTGLRPGELAALRVKHLDLLRGTVRVAENAVRVKGRRHWGPTKTSQGRTVHLPRWLRDELAAYLADRPHDPEALVFSGPKGGPLDRAHFGAEHLKAALAAAGLPGGFRMYDLRHTCASLLAAEGWTPNEVAAQLGHADAAITLRVYTHLFPDRRAALVDRLEAARAAALEAFSAGVWPQRAPTALPLR